MDMTIRAMTPQERLYSYSQSQQITMQTGCIGHLRGDMGSSGERFYSTWDDHRSDLKTDEFKAEFDDVINALRFDENYGGVMKDRSALSKYCYSHPESSFGGDGREFGFRADTEKYSYMLRLNPNQGEYNLYCYCYVRKWLDRHMTQAEKGIRFIDPNYKDLFRIPDGDQIRITHEDGTYTDKVCRYIDEYHVEVGGGWDSMFHICQFAEQMERCNNKVIPLRSSLPEKCFSVSSVTGEMIIVERGKKGYSLTRTKAEGAAAREGVDAANKAMGVTKAQEAAMVAGSMFGWHTPAADPRNYDENGVAKKPKHRDRGDAR